ncbi:MAG TPA: subclass B3 metallo-beta-lactamase [Povalibacter sp.]|nr:subclass B3 metallo-beta-lactamase [Povalibacter sp.]
MMRALLCVLALGAFGVANAADKPADTSMPFDTRSWFEAVEPLHIAGPIYYVGTRDLGVYLITTSAGHILLDGAMPGSQGLIEASIRKLGFKPQDIRLLLITHAHVDHVGTVAYFKKLTGAPLAVMAPDDQLLKSGGHADYLYSEVDAFHFDPVTADRVLKDGDTVTLGNVTLTARHTPGHTRGCTTWITSVEEQGRSWRVVFTGSTSVNPGTRLVDKPSYPGIADDYRHAFSVLETLQPEIFLAAHASFFDLDAKRQRVAKEGVQAFVDPQGYARANAAKREFFEAQLAKEQRTQE